MNQNWREMEAGRPLDRLVAKRLGWRVEKLDDQYVTIGEGGRVVAAITPNERYRVFDGESWTQFHIARDIDMWDWLFDVGILAPYSADLNRALALPFAPQYVISVQRYDADDWGFLVIGPGETPLSVYHVIALKPHELAYHLCCAFLKSEELRAGMEAPSGPRPHR